MIARKQYHLRCSGLLYSPPAPNLTVKHGKVCIRRLCVSEKFNDVRTLPVAVLLQNKDQNSGGRTGRRKTANLAAKTCWEQPRQKFPQQSNCRTELELWLCSRREVFFANWHNCVMTFCEGGQGNFFAIADVPLYTPRVGGQLRILPLQVPSCVRYSVHHFE